MADLFSSHKLYNPINTTPLGDHGHKTERTTAEISCEDKHTSEDREAAG